MNNQDTLKRFVSKGVFPHQWAFTLLFPLRNIFLSPKKLIERIELNPDATVLEIGEMLDYAKKRLEKRSLKNVEYYLCNGESFDFKDNTFDIIYMVTVIGEVEHKDHYIKECYRMLKTGGVLSISELMGDPDKMKIEDIRAIAERHHFSFYRLYGNKRNFTVNFKKEAAVNL